MANAEALVQSASNWSTERHDNLLCRLQIYRCRPVHQQLLLPRNHKARILFNKHGAILKGYDHESPAAAHVAEHGEPLAGMFDGVPPEFADFLSEPAFSINQTTFCFWRKYSDQSWQSGRPSYPAGARDPGGADSLLLIFRGGPGFYADWASDYYEREIDLDAVKRIYRHEPIDLQLIESLNREMTLEGLAADIEEIGYPIKLLPPKL